MRLTRRQFLKALGVTLGSASLQDQVLAALVQAVGQSDAFKILTTSDRVSLSALPWVLDQDPNGVRLRWTAPVFFVEHDELTFLGLPDTVDIYRTGNYDYLENFWDYGLEKLRENPLTLIPTYDASGNRRAVQAVQFENDTGITLAFRVNDSRGVCLSEFSLEDGQPFSFGAHDIWEIEFVGSGSVIPMQGLNNPHTLDLYKFSGSPEELTEMGFEPVATLGVSTALMDGPDNFDELFKRMNQQTTREDGVSLSRSDWQELYDEILSKAFGESSPHVPTPEQPVGAWEAAMLAVMERWEYSVLAGYGFFDYLEHDSNQYDELHSLLDDFGAGGSYLYYVRANYNEFGRSLISNVVPVSGVADPLRIPENASYENPRVVYRTFSDAESVESGALSLDGRPSFLASAVLTWQQTEQPHALGIIVEEKVAEKKLTIDSAQTTYKAFPKHSRNGAGLLKGEARRQYEVSSPFDLEIESSVRTFDGWDRVSEPLPAGPSPLIFSYTPAPPQLHNVRTSIGGKQSDFVDVVITRNEWGLDTFISNNPDLSNSVMLRFYRRVSAPLEVTVRLGEPTRQEKVVTSETEESLQPGPGSLLYSVPVLKSGSPLDLSVGGTVIAGDFNGLVEGVQNGQTLLVRVTPQPNFDWEEFPEVPEVVEPGFICSPSVAAGGGQVVLYNGEITGLLRQDPDLDTLWVPVSEFRQFNPNESEYQIHDPLPRPEDEVQLREYAVQATILSSKFTQTPQSVRSATVALNVFPLPPRQPGLFTVESLGRDYYGRLTIMVTFLEPMEPGRYAISWVEGRGPESLWSDPGNGRERWFKSVALEGLYGPQHLHENKHLFDILEVPEPLLGDADLTVGIQKVDGAGQASLFRLQDLLLEAE